MRLCFEGYFSHHRGDGRSISRNVDLLIILVHDVINLLCYCHWRFSFFIVIMYNFKCSQLLNLLFSFNKWTFNFFQLKTLIIQIQIGPLKIIFKVIPSSPLIEFWSCSKQPNCNFSEMCIVCGKSRVFCHVTD